MERKDQLPPSESRHFNLKKLFKQCIHSLLIACSKEEFSTAFPTFTRAEQDCVHKLFVQVITSLHGNIEDEFESLCLQAKVATILDTIDQLVEEQNLDPLYNDGTNVGHVREELLAKKKTEVQYLMVMLEKAEEQRRLIKARIELLKKEKQESSGYFY